MMTLACLRLYQLNACVALLGSNLDYRHFCYYINIIIIIIDNLVHHTPTEEDIEKEERTKRGVGRGDALTCTEI